MNRRSRVLRLPLLVLACLGAGPIAKTPANVGAQPAQDAPDRGYRIPLIDLAAETHRQIIVDREPGQYLGHPTTVLLDDGRTMLCVYPKGHGRGAIVFKRSVDGGLTWSDRLPTPASWATSQEVPTLHRVVGPDGARRLIMWSGLYPARIAVSEDDGATWSQLEPAGDWGGVVVMASVVELSTGPGQYLAMFHDDGRFIAREPQRADPVVFTLYTTFSRDGGLTWSLPRAVWAGSDVHLCEPGIVRSPDGTQLAALLRENSRRRNSYVIFSNDEGRTWTPPRELPGALTGDRHTARYAPDGRLFISFRDTTHVSAARGDWVGWVGTYDDIVHGREGQYRVRLMDNHVRADCAYPGVEVLPDGTFVTTTYGHWTPGEQPYIVSVRFTLDELDRKAAATRAPEPATGSHRPNVILFLVDDLGWQDTSVPLHVERTPFNDRYHTPSLERLAERGMRFTNAYASAPVCTPTRTSIMTGQSPGRTHITFWTLHKDRDTSNDHPIVRAPTWNMNGLQPDDVTLPTLLRRAGYRTIHVGKAHFGAHGTDGSDPANLGFDVNVAGHGSGGPASYEGLHHFSLAGRQGKDPSTSDSVWDVPGLEAYHGEDVYLTEALALEACRAIEDASKDGVPFYLNFAPYGVHAPIMANRRYLPRYDGLDRIEAAYATMIESVDAALGEIMRTIDTLGIAERTVIIFSSDNGGLSAHARGGEPHTHNAPLKSGKGSAHEGGTRVPTVIAWPAVAAAGASCDVPIVSHDFFPTILAMTGATPAPDEARRIDGRDLSPLLREETGFDAMRPLFWHQPHQWGATGPGIEPFTSVRRGDWKLIYFHAQRRFELYDLANDLGETRDLAADEPALVRELAEVMSAWIEEAGVQLSIDKATGRPVELPHRVAPPADRGALLLAPAPVSSPTPGSTRSASRRRD